MNYLDFLNQVIDRSKKAAANDYKTTPDDGRLAGSLAGLESCRGLSPRKLAEHLIRVNRVVARTFHATLGIQVTPLGIKRGWWLRCYQAEVDWVANCVSAVMQNQGLPVLASHHPTPRAILATAQIVGVKDDPDAPAAGFTPAHEMPLTYTKPEGPTP